MKKLLMSVAVLLLAATTFAQHPVMNSQPLYRTKRLPSRTRLPPEPAGALPPLLSWNPNYFVWERGNTTSRKCLLSAKNT